jgi:hypothetical protein
MLHWNQNNPQATRREDDTVTKTTSVMLICAERPCNTRLACAALPTQAKEPQPLFEHNPTHHSAAATPQLLHRFVVYPKVMHHSH